MSRSDEKRMVEGSKENLNLPTDSKRSPSRLFIKMFGAQNDSMQDTACLGLVHGDDPERCYGEGGGRGVHVWERMCTRGGFMSMYGKTNTV